MKRLFGILIISLSLLTSAIIIQIAKINGRGPIDVAILFVIIPFLIGVLLIFSNDRTKNQDESYVSNHEIEKELEEKLD